MDLVILVFGILWIIKGEIRIHKSPFWDERRIDASTGRALGLIMVVGFLMSLCLQSVAVPQGINAAFMLILAILPIFVGIVSSEKAATGKESQSILPSGCPPNCAGASLRQGRLKELDLSKADLREADLRWAYLSGANLSKADLSSADLREAHVDRANLQEANLRGANLRKANLCQANLAYADLLGADLAGALFRQGKLNGTVLLETDLPIPSPITQN